jgi:hypothetical protein
MFHLPSALIRLTARYRFQRTGKIRQRRFAVRSRLLFLLPTARSVARKREINHMTTDERNELLKDASTLAYQAIRFSGLYKELTSSEWDALAQGLGERLIYRLEGWVEAEIERVEAQKETVSANG